MTPPVHPDGPTPPEAIAQYLAAEQEFGRIRPDVDCLEAAIVLLAALFGIGLMPTPDGSVDTPLVHGAVALFMRGLQV